MSIGDRIRDLRWDRRLKQGELARRAGIAQNTLSRIELGETTPSVPTLEKIARGLSVDVSSLLHEPVGAGKAEAPGPGAIKGADIGEDLGIIREFLKARTGTAWLTLPDEEWDQWWLSGPREEVVERYRQLKSEWQLLKYEWNAWVKGAPSALSRIENPGDILMKLWTRATFDAPYSVPRREESDKEFQRRRLREGEKHPSKHPSYYEPLEPLWPKPGDDSTTQDQEHA